MQRPYPGAHTPVQYTPAVSAVHLNKAKKKVGVRQRLGNRVLGRQTSMCKDMHSAGSVGSEWELGVVRDWAGGPCGQFTRALQSANIIGILVLRAAGAMDGL